MSQQHPQWGAPQQPQQPGWAGQPTQPGYGYPPQQQPGWGAPPPQPPKRKTGKILGIIGGVFVGLIVIGAIAGGGKDTTDDSNKDKAVATSSAQPKASEEEAADTSAEEAPAEDKSQAEQFQDCVAKSGTATEKEAVGHVTKVTGTDKRNDILDAAEVFTDYTGGLIGPHASDGKLIASAFASCYESDNGLVTVYDKDGELLSNGNY